MPGSRSIARLLERHKVSLASAIEAKGAVLQVLSRKGVLTPDEEKHLASEPDVVVRGDILVHIFAQKGFNAFRELCITMEMECPQLQLTTLLLDSADGVNHSRENSNVSAVLPMSPKYNNRDLEMNRSPSGGSISGAGPPDAANGLESSSNADACHKVKEKPILSEGIHELLEEPVEEMVISNGYSTSTSTPQMSPNVKYEDFAEGLKGIVKTGTGKVGGERIAWEFHHVQLSRVPGYGFGIAVSGGRDNPHFTNGDPSIAISDVLKAGPAEGKLQINDRVISANNISLEGVDYATAVQVLRDSGQTVNLVVKRRVVLPPVASSAVNGDVSHVQPSPQELRVNLNRNRKKEDFGVVLGCKIFIKEIVRRSPADKDGILQEHDLVERINNTSLDGLTLKEAKKLIEASKDKLELVVKRESGKLGKKGKPRKDDNNTVVNGNGMEPKVNGHYGTPAVRPAQVATPPRPPPPEDAHSDSTSTANTLPLVRDDKTPSKQRTSITNGSASKDYGIGQGRSDPYASPEQKGLMPDPRFISFKKSGSVGIRLTGGNEVGIFVTAVQPGSPAAQQGLQPGDKILKVNDMDMKGVTREEAVLFLLSLHDQINLIAQYRRDEYDQIVSLQRGDSFYIKTHFNYDTPDRKDEMPFKKSDVFHVVDTLHNGVVGAWQVFKMGGTSDQVQKGVIPNKTRAEEVAIQQFNAAKKEQNMTENTKTSFFRRKREKSRLRSKSLGKDHWEDLVWSEGMSKFPAYERVTLRHPGFPRPVVIFGPVADIARENLLRDFPGKYSSPQQESDDNKGVGKSGIVRLSAIRSLMDRNRHALLDVTPNAVDKLNYAQFYPIVIFARTDAKQTIKDCRSGVPKGLLASATKRDWLTNSRRPHLSSKKLLEQCQKLEKLWSHIFTATIDLTSDNWYNKIVELIDKQQASPIWMSETKPEESFSDDFLFPMSSTSRLLSYNSSPESDGEFCDPETTTTTPSASRMHLANIESTKNGALTSDEQAQEHLPRSTSDPNLVPKNLPPERIPDYNAPPPYAITPQKDDRSPYHQGSDSKYGFAGRARNSSSSIQNNVRPSVTESVDELPLPPPPPASSGPPPVLMPPEMMIPPSNGEQVPSIPPKIDRQKKPSRRSGHYSKSSLGPASNSSSSNGDQNGLYGDKMRSLDRNAHIRDNHMSAFEAYNSLDAVDGGNGSANGRPRSLGGQYSLIETSPGKTTNGRGIPPDAGYRTGKSLPYGYAPSGSPGQGSDNSEKYRHMDYKPVPPPKTTLYKPVPPPKPKSYPRTPSQPPVVPMEGNYMNSGNHSTANGSEYISYSNTSNNNNNGQYSSSSYHSTPSGRFDDEGSNGFDSGQGSSLDREYNGYHPNQHHQAMENGSMNPMMQHRYANPPGPPPPPQSRGQYYYNLPPTAGDAMGPRKNPGDGLDLSNREYRGSAFELYKKPMSLQAQQQNYHSLQAQQPM